MAMLHITSSIFDNYKNAFIDSFLSILGLYFEKKNIGTLSINDAGSSKENCMWQLILIQFFKYQDIHLLAEICHHGFAR